MHTRIGRDLREFSNQLNDPTFFTVIYFQVGYGNNTMKPSVLSALGSEIKLVGGGDNVKYGDFANEEVFELWEQANQNYPNNMMSFINLASCRQTPEWLHYQGIVDGKITSPVYLNDYRAACNDYQDRLKSQNDDKIHARIVQELTDLIYIIVRTNNVINRKCRLLHSTSMPQLFTNILNNLGGFLNISLPSTIFLRFSAVAEHNENDEDVARVSAAGVDARMSAARLYEEAAMAKIQSMLNNNGGSPPRLAEISEIIAAIEGQRRLVSVDPLASISFSSQGSDPLASMSFSSQASQAGTDPLSLSIREDDVHPASSPGIEQADIDDLDDDDEKANSSSAPASQFASPNSSPGRKNHSPIKLPPSVSPGTQTKRRYSEDQSIPVDEDDYNSFEKRPMPQRSTSRARKPGFFANAAAAPNADDATRAADETILRRSNDFTSRGLLRTASQNN